MVLQKLSSREFKDFGAPVHLVQARRHSLQAAAVLHSVQAALGSPCTEQGTLLGGMGGNIQYALHQL